MIILVTIIVIRNFHTVTSLGRCSSDRMIQWIIIRNVIMYEEHVSINLFSNTNDNKNPLSSLIHSSSVFVYTGFRNSATTLTLLCNSSCSGHVILAQILLDSPCFRFANLKRFVGLVGQKKIPFLVHECSLFMWNHP